jgi:hypothetical protein
MKMKMKMKIKLRGLLKIRNERQKQPASGEFALERTAYRNATR